MFPRLVYASVLALAFSAACSSNPKTEENPKLLTQESTERSFTVVIDAIAPTKNPGMHFVYRGIDTEKDLRKQIDLEMITKGLGKNGFKEATKGAKANIEIEVDFKLEKPFTGTAILGNITPYTHIVTLKAYQGKKALWETQISTKTEEEDIRMVLPIMLAGAEGFFGKTSKGKQEISIKKSDSKVKALESKP